ncbi:MAG: LamG-like jellyroll fold domain-containing protein [Bacteroidota bacterium]|nr:LamG-like jellyroll fold domain-containing protein [Bacteroidota bacterium]
MSVVPDRIISISALLLVLGTASLSAQSSGPQYRRADNGVIAVAAEVTTGQFRIEASDGTPLQFRDERGVTGFANVHIGNNTFTNNLLQRAVPPRGSMPMRGIRVEALTDRVRITAALPVGADTLRFLQDLVPALEGDYAYINIITSVENPSPRSHAVGILMMQDVMIGARDGVDLVVDATPVTRETAFSGDALPDAWEASAAGGGFTVRGRLRSATADAPDVFIAGNWQFAGYLGTAIWNYVASGLPITDDAVLLQWNEAVVAPGRTRVVRSDYGYLAVRDAALTCALPDLRVDEDSTRFSPDPIPATATVRNTGTLPLSGIDLQITLPSKLSLVAGETQVKSIPGPLLPGAQATLTWLLEAAVVDTATRVGVDFSISAPTELRRDCRAETVIPPLAVGDFVVECADSIRLTRDEEGNGYAPDPFTISAVVRNTGTGMLMGLQAELQLPPEIVLVSGSAVVPVFPDPLAPGGVAVVSWEVRGIVQRQPTVAPYRVRTFGAGLQDACESAVLLPPFAREPCNEVGISTAGTEFWFCFLPDLVGAADEYLRLFASAPAGAELTLYSSMDQGEQRRSVPAGGMRSFEVDEQHNSIPVETPVSRGLRLRSDRAVHAFAGNFRDRHSDGMTVLPVHALGTRYVTAGYNFAEAYEHFIVLATEDGTGVTITPAAFTSTLRPGKQPFTVTLDAGEVYYVKAYIAGQGGSLTGSIVESTRPVAVFSGAESGWVPVQGGNPSAFLNPMSEQMIPVRYCGREYAAVPFRSRARGDTYRVVATEDNTTVTVGGAPAITLPEAGDWTEGILAAPAVISADKPVLVAQYANSARWDADTNEYGDGSMLLLAPTDRFMNCHYFPAGMLLADAALVSNISASLNDRSWLEAADTPPLSAPVFTAECMLQPNGGGTVMSRLAMPDALWEVQYDFNRARLALAVGRPPAQQLFYTADNLITPGTWGHVALVMNGPAGRAALYVNGQQVIDAQFTSRDFAGKGGLAFGGVYGVSAKSLLWAQFDECRFWQVERTPAQLRAAMDGRLSALDRAGLAGYWPFCDGLRDETPFGHDLAPQGNPILGQSWGLSSAYNCTAMEDSSFVTIVAPAGAESAVTVNFTPLPAQAFSPAGGGYVYAQRKLPTGINRVETSDARGIGVSSYGFAFHDAYTTYTGFRVSDQTQRAHAPHMPEGLQLDAPYPSPVRDAAHVRFSLPRSATAQLVLTDVRGRNVRTLAAGRFDGGTHRVGFDAGDLAPGRYQLRLFTMGFFLQRPVVLLR